VRAGLRAVTVRYPGRPLSALDRVDLDLQPGELVAVVGASGAGNTTLGRVLLGLTRPDEGFVVAGGRPLTEADLDWWRDQVAWPPSIPPWYRARWPRTWPWDGPAPTWRRSRTRPARLAPTGSSGASRTATTP
jgi:energy-coupling factor transporter ATP-binding protein EcfA2